jgi:hypothetical protein
VGVYGGQGATNFCVEAIKDFMIHDSEFSFGMDLIIITELLPERLPQVTSNT